MQPIQRLKNWLMDHAANSHGIFSVHDLRALFPDVSDASFKTLLSRSVSSGLLVRMCRGVYYYERAGQGSGNILYHVARALRPHAFNYISLESALSDAGVISQIPMNWISIMSSGRSSTISCGSCGTVEFIHTAQRPEQLGGQLFYDADTHMWRARVGQAIRDMKATKRDMNLIDWDATDDTL